MARKIDRGLDIYDLLIDLVMNLTPLQAKNLYIELSARYIRKGRTKLYNRDGELDSKGKIRLCEYQYKALRTDYGDTYIKRAFAVLYDYIEYLERNQESSAKYRSKLKDYNSKTHINFLKEDGWVYEKCKSFICKDRIKIPLNPYTIEDFNTAKEYIKMIPKDIRENAFDVKMLMMKFPELKEVDYDE